MSVITFIILISAVLALAITIRWLSNEHFYNLPQIGTRYLCPTINQSYDIRGDVPIPRNDWAVYNSSIGSRQPEFCKYRRLE
jgi:hypothetical protein